MVDMYVEGEDIPPSILSPADTYNHPFMIGVPMKQVYLCTASNYHARYQSIILVASSMEEVQSLLRVDGDGSYNYEIEPIDTSCSGVVLRVRGN